MEPRRVYIYVRAAGLAAAIVLLSLYGRAEWSRLGAADVVYLAGVALVVAVLARLRGPLPLFGRYGRRDDGEGGVLALPLFAVVFATYGWYEVALLSFIGAVLSPAPGRRVTGADRLLSATMRIIFWAAISPLHDLLAATIVAPSLRAFGLFALVNALWILLFVFLFNDVLAALRSAKSVLGIWRQRTVGPRTLAILGALLFWGFITEEILRRDGAAFALALALPLPALAIALAQLNRFRLRVQRLTLSRDAIDAMLGKTDPIPQIKSILATVDPRIVRESIEIFALGGARNDRWSSVANVGALPNKVVRLLSVKALGALVRSTEVLEVARGNDGYALAYSARDGSGALLGALVVYRDLAFTPQVAPREFERAAAEIAPLLREFGSIVTQRSEAAIDTLTGLANRRAVGVAVEEAVRHIRSGGTYAMLLLDVDHFKRINDQLGHAAGDRALARIGEIIARTVREDDLAGRFGGEEFIVLMRDAERETALTVAERLRVAVEASGIAYFDGTPITMSIGVAFSRANDRSGEAIIERADGALYQAKDRGRNRVVEAPLLSV